MGDEERLQRRIDILNRKLRACEKLLEESSREAFLEAELQQTLNDLLSLSSQVSGLDDMLAAALEILMALDFLQVENRGAIFLLDHEKKVLTLACHHNFSDEQISRCSEVPLGTCLCGRVAVSGREEIGGDIDPEIHLPSPPHSHYCAPLAIGSWIFGVLCVVLAPGNVLPSRERKFLRAVVEILSAAVQRFFYEQELAEYQVDLEGRLQDAVAESRKASTRYRSIFQHALAGIYQSTVATGAIRVCNPAFARILGYDSPEAVREVITDAGRQLYVDPEDRARLLQELRNGPVHECITRFLRRDGRSIWVSISCMLHVDGKGEEFIEGHLLDVTDRMEAMRLQKIAALSTLARGIAHDFNNMLTVINGSLDLVKMSLDQEDCGQAASDVEQAKATAARAGELVRQLQIYARGEDPVKRPVNLGEIVQRTVTALGLRGAFKSRVSCNEQILVECDPVQISRALQNLIHNAVQAMPEGGNISVECRRTRVTQEMIPSLAPGPYALLQVMDTGEGIDESRLSSIFEPYTSTRGKDRGLGLSIVQGIVAAHNGYVSVVSTVGRGTTFSLYLPL